MKYIITLLLTLSVLSASSQDVKIQGPKRQATVSNSKQNNSTDVVKQRQLEEKRRKEQDDLRQQEQENQERFAREQKEKEELARKNALRWDENKHALYFMGKQYEMIHIDGGSFLMGAREQDLKAIEKDIYSNKEPQLITPGSTNNNTSSFNGQYEFRNAKPTHNVTLNPFYIGKIEVTGALWNAVMGTYYDDNLPVGNASWYDCQQFIEKLNEKVGVKFRLPTEAEWEFAARGGNKSSGYCYSGSNRLYNVSTNGRDIRQPRGASKSPNELGLYDMSGSVWEWCQDWYGNYSNLSQTNPKGPSNGSEKILRGGNYHEYRKEIQCCVAYRRNLEPASRSSFSDQGLRLCLDVDSREISNFSKKQENASQQYSLRWDNNSKTFFFNGHTYKMIEVEGGTFTMGVPKGEKHLVDKITNINAKAHKVTLSGYYIGQTEFTRGFLRAVTGDCSGPAVDDQLPAALSWEVCKSVVDFLSKITGLNFSIPTEAQWEYAARGGNKSQGFRYSGTAGLLPSILGGYAVRGVTSPQPVATRKPNELGIYDMTGNVWEWCYDWFDKYDSKTNVNPQGPIYGTQRVYRGGSYDGDRGTYVFERFCEYPDKTYSNVGFRPCLNP